MMWLMIGIWLAGVVVAVVAVAIEERVEEQRLNRYVRKTIEKRTPEIIKYMEERNEL